jgi:putative ABC transport system permease protein
LIVFQENRFCPTTSRLPEDYSRKIKEVPGVRDVMPIQVWTNNCRASLDIVVFNGADPQQIKSTRPLTLTGGDWETFARQRDAAIVGRNVAQRRGLKTGDQFSIGDISVKVAGVFSSTVPSEENLIYTSLAFLQYTRGLDAAGLVTQHEVLLTDDADPDQVASEIDATLRAGSVATKTRRKGAFQASTLSDLVDLIGFAHWLGYACVGLVLSLVATTTVMSVQDRIKEYAVLQTIGVRPLRTMRLVLAESTILCLVGGIAGTGLAMTALAIGGFAIGAEGATIAFRPSISLAVTGAAVSLIVGVAAGMAPAIQAATVPIVNALRQA